MKKLFASLVLMFMVIGVSLAQNVNVSLTYDDNQCEDIGLQLLQINDLIVGNYLWTSSKISAEDSIVKAEILMTLDTIVNYFNPTIAELNNDLLINKQQIDSLLDCIGYLCVPDTTVAENSPPSIEITAPNNNAQILITTSTQANVTATDSDGTIDSVVFFIDDVRQSVDVSSPYTFNLPVNTAGNFELKAIAYDNDSASSSDSINYSVYENALPIVNITAPSDGDTLTINTSFTASVTATDSDGTIDSVVFFINDVRQSVDTSSPYTYNIPTNSSITRELKAVAYDNLLGLASDSLIYYINDTNTIDYDTIFINWTAYGSSDVESLPWNDAKVNSLDALPPDTILLNVYSTNGDTLGPLTRTSNQDITDNLSFFNNATYYYSLWPTEVSQRGIETDDTLSFNLAGFEANQEVTFRIFGGGPYNSYSDSIIVTIGDSVNSVTGLNQQESTKLSSAYGTANESGNLSFSIISPSEEGLVNAYMKGMEIITTFIEDTTIIQPPVIVSCEEAPVVDITSVSNNQNIILNNTNLGIVTVSDNDGIDSVVFFIDDVRMAVDLSSPFSYTLPTGELGTFEFKAIAYDTCGQSGVDSLNFNVVEGSDPIYSNAQFCEENGLVVMEAENLNLGGTAWEIGSSTVGNRNGWTGTGYIVGPKNSFNYAGLDVITTTIQITNPGIYRVRWRNRAGQVHDTRTSEENDTWLKFNVPNGDFYAEKSNQGISGTRYYPAPYCNTISGSCPKGASSNGYFKVFVSNGNWDWKTATSDGQDWNIFVNFDAPGTYEMYISTRSKYHEIDRIVLYKPSSVTEGTALSLLQSETQCAPPLACAFPPTVKINSQTIINQGNSYSATVSAIDNDGIDSVVFFINDVRQSVDINSPYAYSLPTSTLGTYEFKAVAYDTCGQSGADSINYTVKEKISNSAPDFPGGRIALIHDGNNADADDHGAMAMMFMLAYYAGVVDNITFCGYNSLLTWNNPRCRTDYVTNGNGTYSDWCAIMNDVRSFVVTNMGVNDNVLYDLSSLQDAGNFSEATNALVAEMNASTSSNPLWILNAGPSKIYDEALKLANSSALNYVNFISHSNWNETNNQGNGSYNEVISKYPVVDIRILDQNTPCNNNSSCNGRDDFADEGTGWQKPEPTTTSGWDWMYLSQDGNSITDWVRKSNNEDFFRYEKSKIVDWSDAGMMWYLLSGGPNGGDEYGTQQKVKSLVENGQMP